MVAALAIVLLFQLVGEVVSRALGLPLPGPVLGMIAMVVALALSPRLGALIKPTAQGLLQHLSLLFVPAGVGVVAHLPTLASHGLALALARGAASQREARKPLSIRRCKFRMGLINDGSGSLGEAEARAPVHLCLAARQIAACVHEEKPGE